jgi:hypothetical protein
MNKKIPYIQKLQRKYNEKPGYLVPFEDTITKIKRVFFIKGFENIDNHFIKTRGNHANLMTSEYLICLNGTFSIELETIDNIYKFTLNNDCDMLYVPNQTFVKMYNFSKDCIILVICDDNHDENNVILK